MNLRSWAKVNLYLDVLCRRPDGFHELVTLFERISLHDTLRIILRRDGAIRFHTRSSEVPSDDTNLCVRAARLLQARTRTQWGADIYLTKRVPVGAGLGGGSGNAATVLLGLNRLWRTKLSRSALVAVGRQLGSDVPFFLYEHRFAVGRNKGDAIRALPSLSRIRLWKVLAVPRIHVATPGVYRHWDVCAQRNVALTRPPGSVTLVKSALMSGDVRRLKGVLYNGLEQASIDLYPAIGRLKDAFVKAGGSIVLMSGSGPSVFSVCRNRDEALRLKRALSAFSSQWRIFIVHTA